MAWIGRRLLKSMRARLIMGRSPASDLRSSPEGSPSALGPGGALFSGGIIVVLVVVAMYPSPKTWMFEYFPNDRLEGEPSRDLRPRLDILDIRNDLPPGLPDREGFSLRMRSCLEIAESGLYRIDARANDGMRLQVDGVVAVDAWEGNLPKVVDKHLTLTAGEHALTIEYVNRSGPAFLAINMSDAAQRTVRPLTGRTTLPEKDGRCANANGVPQQPKDARLVAR